MGDLKGVETHAWAVVLAGGKGVRLRGLTRHVYGEDRPKQYAALTGGKSLLRQTASAAMVRLLDPPRTPLRPCMTLLTNPPLRSPGSSGFPGRSFVTLKHGY